MVLYNNHPKGVRMNHYYYIMPDDQVIRISANRKPGPNTIPKRTTWVVYEYWKGKWHMSPFPEITLGQILKLQYIGCVKQKP